MNQRGIRHGATATALATIALTAAACGGHTATSTSAATTSYPAVDGAQLKTALLADSDMPTGFTAEPSQSGNVSPEVTSPTPSPAGTAVSGAAASDPACATLDGALAQSTSGKGGDGSNAYAKIEFQTAGLVTVVDEELEAYPADNLAQLRAQLSTARESLARCSTLTTAISTVTASAVSGPTLGQSAAWFSFTDTLDNHVLKLARTTIIVGNVGITLTIADGATGVADQVPVLETIARKAVARVTSLQR